MSERPIPTVSVVMPAYNAEKYIGEAIESILNQTFNDFEFIIINDGSSDKTKDIILSYKDPRIVYLENEKNSGIVITLNKGLDAARGKYLARMDADDVSHPKRFAKQINFLETHSDIIICGTDIEVFGDGIEPYIFRQVCQPDQCAAGLFFNCCFAHPTVMWRNEVAKKNNLRYLNEYRGLEDFRLWWEFAKIGKIANISTSLLRYRKHPGQETKNITEKTRKAFDEFITQRLDEFNLELSGRERSIFFRYCSGDIYNFTVKDIDDYQLFAKKICKSSPFPIRTTKLALKISFVKALVFAADNSKFTKKEKLRLINKAFFAGILPPIWYLKYLKSIVLK